MTTRQQPHQQQQPQQKQKQFKIRKLTQRRTTIGRVWVTLRMMVCSVRLTFLICWTIYLLNAINGEIILRVDPLALLSATLRTYQKAACDNDQILVACPRGTSISIEFAQYNNYVEKDGISIEELCPQQNSTSTNNIQLQMRAKAKHLLRGSIFGTFGTQKVPALRQVAQYNNNMSILSTSSTNQSSTGDEHKHGDNCMWPNALQYSLLQTVVEACQKKKHCRFSGSAPYYSMGSSGVGDTSGTSSYHTSSTNTNGTSNDYNSTTTTTTAFSASNGTQSAEKNSSNSGVQPCPKQRKIVEIAYKCRPYEFRSKVACHNDVAQLECNPYSRIAVYSASFGRTEYESIQCPQPQGVREETCLAAYATETVMQICHGRRRCNLAADANTFGSPCRPNSRMYLKVVYTCVPKQVLKDRYESETEADEVESDHNDSNDLYDDELNYKESEAIPKLYSNTTATAHTILSKSNASEANNSFEFDSDTLGGNGAGINPVMTHSSDLTVEDDQERLYLYLLICGSASIIISIVLIATRLLLQKRDHTASEVHSPTAIKVTAASGGFNDNISEIDADIDLTTPIPMPVASLTTNENIVTYAAKSVCTSATPNSFLQSHNSTSTAANPALIANPLVYGHRASPDIIGISSNAFVSANNNKTGGVVGGVVGGIGVGVPTAATTSAYDDKQQITPLDGILAPTIVIGTGNNVVDTISVSCDAHVVATAALPLTTITQYTTAPSLRAGYIINAEAVLANPSNSSPLSPNTTATMLKTTEALTTTPAIMSANVAIYASQLLSQQQQQQQQQQHQYQQQLTSPSSNHQTPATIVATLRRNKIKQQQQEQHQQQQQQQCNISYDGTAPRTLSTGVPVNSNFYYG